ncbi:MAG: sarcinarray family MAST domain-containing protein [Candidatus Methanoperedens sp.]|nr:sarcinarray family MAST domain-containing protein [Candidatus Methanoperedens sp.]
MKSMVYVIILIVVLLLNFQIAGAADNEYGTVKARFNGINATVTGIELKVGEPVEVQVEIESKINGHVTLILLEPGITKAFDVLSGPSKVDEKISNLNIESGWSKTYTWKLAPNGAWKDGNAPINLLVKFYNTKLKNDKIVQFTIANPYILDEQYSGAVPTPETSASPTGIQSKETPFIPVIFAVGALMLAWRWRRKQS